MPTIDEILSRTRDTLTVSRVYGEPFEDNGLIVIPAAAIRGGGCGAGDEDASTGGLGMSARPVGAYVIKDGEVDWVPAADTTRVIVMSQVLGIVALLVLRSIIRRRKRRT